MTHAQRAARTGMMLALLLGLAGCFKGTFENRLACSLDGSEAYFVSKYGSVGVSAEIARADAQVACAAAVAPPAARGF